MTRRKRQVIDARPVAPPVCDHCHQPIDPSEWSAVLVRPTAIAGADELGGRLHIECIGELQFPRIATDVALDLLGGFLEGLAKPRLGDR